jgi:hypothetical protein
VVLGTVNQADSGERELLRLVLEQGLEAWCKRSWPLFSERGLLELPVRGTCQ